MTSIRDSIRTRLANTRRGRTLQHFENVTIGKEPFVMNREQKRAVVAARALSDTSKPPPLPPPLLSAAAALWI